MIAASLIFKDGFDMLRAMVEDLEASDAQDILAAKVAVDNGSEDRLIGAWLQGRGWIVLTNPTNIGIPASRNQTYWRIAGAFSDVKAILELHTDMRFPRRWLEPLVAELEDPDVWIACSSIIRGMRAEYIPFVFEGDPATLDREHLEQLCDLGRQGRIQLDPFAAKFAHPCLYRFGPFKARDFYDDLYQWQEGEDIDLFYDWIVRQGKKAVVCPESWVLHYTGLQRVAWWKREAFYHNQAYFRYKWGLDPELGRDALCQMLFGFNPESGA